MSNANRMLNALPVAQPEALQVAVRFAMPTAMHERNGLTKNYHLNLGVELPLRTAHAHTPNPLFPLPFVGRFAPRPAVIHRASPTENRTEIRAPRRRLNGATMTTEPTTVADEITAMRRIVGAMDRLDVAAQNRVVAWLWDRYHQTVDDELARIQETR